MNGKVIAFCKVAFLLNSAGMGGSRVQVGRWSMRTHTGGGVRVQVKWQVLGQPETLGNSAAGFYLLEQSWFIAADRLCLL